MVRLSCTEDSIIETSKSVLKKEEESKGSKTDKNFVHHNYYAQCYSFIVTVLAHWLFSHR